MAKFQSKEEIAKDLAVCYLQISSLSDDLEERGISIGALEYVAGVLEDAIPSILGFPVDDSAENPESSYCRDELFDLFPGSTGSRNIDDVAACLVERLLARREELKKSDPGLFS